MKLVSAAPASFLLAAVSLQESAIAAPAMKNEASTNEASAIAIVFIFLS